MVLDPLRPIAQVARELGLGEGTLGNWINAWKKEHPDHEEALTLPERARLRELERENRDLRMQNEFLKRAAAQLPRRSNRERQVRAHRSGEGTI
jgi:transposase